VDVVGDQPAADPARPLTCSARARLQAGGRWSYELLRARGNSSRRHHEVLKNIVAERVLGLPKAG